MCYINLPCPKPGYSEKVVPVFFIIFSFKKYLAEKSLSFNRARVLLFLHMRTVLLGCRYGTEGYHSHADKSNQIKSLLLSHHHSTSALVSEILMSVLQTVQKNNRQFTYGQTVQKNCTGAFTVLQTVQKKQQQFTYGQTVQKNNSNLHMDSTYLQTVQKTMCKIHIHVLSTLSVL